MGRSAQPSTRFRFKGFGVQGRVQGKHIYLPSSHSNTTHISQRCCRGVALLGTAWPSTRFRVKGLGAPAKPIYLPAPHSTATRISSFLSCVRNVGDILSEWHVDNYMLWSVLCGYPPNRTQWWHKLVSCVFPGKITSCMYTGDSQEKWMLLVTC